MSHFKVKSSNKQLSIQVYITFNIGCINHNGLLKLISENYETKSRETKLNFKVSIFDKYC